MALRDNLWQGRKASSPRHHKTTVSGTFGLCLVAIAALPSRHSRCQAHHRSRSFLRRRSRRSRERRSAGRLSIGYPVPHLDARLPTLRADHEQDRVTLPSSKGFYTLSSTNPNARTRAQDVKTAAVLAVHLLAEDLGVLLEASSTATGRSAAQPGRRWCRPWRGRAPTSSAAAGGCWVDRLRGPWRGRASRRPVGRLERLDTIGKSRRAAPGGCGPSFCWCQTVPGSG